MRRVLLFASVGVLALAPNAWAQPERKGHDVRWDLAQVIQGTALAGGTDVGRDAATGDTVSLTGSGDAEAAEGNAAGGGTFLHRNARGAEVAHGVYVVTGFLNWEEAGGTLPAADGIGHADEASAGILTLMVRLFPSGGGHTDAVLGVHCALPGATAQIEEGITLAIGKLHFVQHGGVTLFHIQK